MTRPVIVHLVDDATAGGVTRLLSHLSAAPAMTALADHRVQLIPRRRLGAPRLAADMIVSHLSVSWSSLPALMALRAVNPATPLVHVEHSYTEGFTTHRVPRLGRFLTLLRAAYALFDRIVAVSDGQARWLLDNTLVAPEALVTIPSVVDVAPFLALTQPVGAPRALLAMGRLDPQKGFDVLITAFRGISAPDLRLTITGDGPERAQLEALAEGDSRITFTGTMVDPVTAIAAAHAVLMPSRWEAYGLVALEARAAGRLVLASNIDGLQDHIASGAVAVAETTVTAWQDALRTLAAADETRRLDVARARRDAAAAPAHFAAGWADLIKTLAVRQENGLAA